MNTSLSAALVALFLAAPAAAAQTDYYVDPQNGSDTAAGTQTDPFQTLTHALTVAVSGDGVILRGGTYSTSETFPIALEDRVDVEAFDQEVPVFDGNGAATVFTLGEDVTGTTRFIGVTITDCAVGFEIPSGRSVEGLIVQRCEFDGFTDAGVRATLDTGNTDEQLQLRDLTFSGNSANEAVDLVVDAGTALTGPGIWDCAVVAGVDRGISVEARDDGEVREGFELARNRFEGYAAAGVLLQATGSGGNPLSVSTIGCRLSANRFVGAGANENGLQVLAQIGGVGEGAEVTSPVYFNNFDGNRVNLHCETINDAGSRADVVLDVYGNVIQGATRAGVELAVTLPNSGLPNNDPNFGPGHVGGVPAGLNTFTGNAEDFFFGPGVTNTIAAQKCWFPAGGATNNGGSVSTLPILDDELSGTIADSIPPNTDVQVEILAASGTAFVDYDGSGTVGQLSVLVDGVEAAQEDVLVPLTGSSVLVQVSGLTSGVKTVTLINPGGQTGEVVLVVSGSAGESGDDDSGCFVATAAYGDLDAPEVVELRRFRDRYLLSTAAGRACVRAYYEHGPVAASWIAERPWARAATRVALAPPTAIAAALNRWNAGQRLAFGVLLLGIAFTFARPRGSRALARPHPHAPRSRGGRPPCGRRRRRA